MQVGELMARYEFARKLTAEPDAFYAIGKIGDWIRYSGTGECLGNWPITQLRQSLNAFKAEIAKTGRNPEKEPVGVAGELPLINYALDELEKFMTGKPAEIATRKAAEVFQEFLHAKFYHLREMAQELEREYAE